MQQEINPALVLLELQAKAEAKAIEILKQKYEEAKDYERLAFLQQISKNFANVVLSEGDSLHKSPSGEVKC